jgi:hypothetical protein
MPPPSVACITWIKAGSSSFKPILNVGVLLNKFANSAQVDCTNFFIASLMFFALDLVIGPSGTCKGSTMVPINLPCPNSTRYKAKMSHFQVFFFFFAWVSPLLSIFTRVLIENPLFLKIQTPYLNSNFEI